MFQSVNRQHDSEFLKENNDFVIESSFVGIINERLYYNCKDEITVFKINSPQYEELHNKTFIKAPNNYPTYKYLTKDIEDITMIYAKYNCKIDCDGNLYLITEDKSLYLIGYYDFEKKIIEQ